MTLQAGASSLADAGGRALSRCARVWEVGLVIRHKRYTTVVHVVLYNSNCYYIVLLAVVRRQLYVARRPTCGKTTAARRHAAPVDARNYIIELHWRLLWFVSPDVMWTASRSSRLFTEPNRPQGRYCCCCCCCCWWW